MLLRIAAYRLLDVAGMVAQVDEKNRDPLAVEYPILPRIAHLARRVRVHYGA